MAQQDKTILNLRRIMDTNFPDSDKPRRRFGRSFEVLEIVKILSKTQPGDIVTYDVLSEAIMGNCSPGEPKYPYILNARRILINEHKMVFKAVPNSGVERLNDVQIVDRSERKLASTALAAKKEMRILTFVDFDKLSEEQRLTHNTQMSIFNVIKTVGQTDKVKMIKNVIGNMGNRLEIAETVKAFSGVK